MGFFKRISTILKTNENAASDKAEDSDKMSNQIMTNKQEQPVTTKQQIATHLSQEDPIEKLRLTESSFNALTCADVQTVGEVLKLVESGELRAIHGLRSTSILEIEVKLAQLEILDNSEIEASTDITPDQNDINLAREESAEKPSLTQHSPNQLHTDIQAVEEVAQQVESSEPPTISEVEADTDAIPDQNDVSLSREDSTQEQNLIQHPTDQLHTDIPTVGEDTQQVESSKLPTISEGEANINTILEQNYVHLSQEDSIGQLNLKNRSFNALTRAGIRTVGELIQLVQSGELRTIPALGRKSILEITARLSQGKFNASEAEANTDASLALNDIYLSPEDTIEKLNLSRRSFNALTQAGVRTVGEILQLIESGGLQNIRSLGAKSILEIEDKLIQGKSEVESPAETDAIPDKDDTYLLSEDPIEKLNLSKRSFNALTRTGTRTVGEVLELIESARLQLIRELGTECILEITEILTQVKILDNSEIRWISPHVWRWLVVKILNDSEVESKRSKNEIPEQVVEEQAQLVRKQLLRGLLHEKAAIAEKSIKNWLAEIEKTESNRVYEVLATILGSSLNICEEIEFFLSQISGQYRMTILLSTYGFETKTLAQTGEELGISRERVRQIRNELKDKTTTISNLKARPALLRMQSALLIAGDLGMDITYEQWTQHIRSSGLIGDWTSQDFVGTDAVEVMTAICNLLDDCKIHWLQIPESLRHVIQPVTSDISDVPAKIPHAFESLPNEVKRLINGHTKNSGGVHVKWLSQESGRELEEIKNILQQGGYKAFSEDWFIPTVLDNPRQISHRDICYRCLGKMLQYCGPLTIDDLCGGLRHVLSRTRFPVPPPDVIAEIARIHNYRRENELYYWYGTYDENLKKSKGESIIMNCLEQIGPVLNHSELAHAFIESDLSYPSLHSTLQRSPLFERIESGLYKLRGREVTYQDIERAKAAREQQPLRPEVEYRTDGNIIVSVTLNAIAVGSGTILCERFPDLNGNWPCYVDGEGVGELNATENEFRHLKKPFELLNCQPGERLKFTFNTWERTVAIQKEGLDAKG